MKKTEWKKGTDRKRECWRLKYKKVLLKIVKVGELWEVSIREKSIVLWHRVWNGAVAEVQFNIVRVADKLLLSIRKE